jgi:hypothetical protein
MTKRLRRREGFARSAVSDQTYRGPNLNAFYFLLASTSAR